MTTISAVVVADSITAYGRRVTTIQTRYPRWIHAEGRTHRQLRLGEELDVYTPSPMEDPDMSRNASSSRAIPVSRLIADVLEDPAVPMFWGANQKGMQAGEECDSWVHIPDPYVEEEHGAYHVGWGRDEVSRESAWRWGMDQAVSIARAFDEAGYHKQIVNRLIEPFSHIDVLWTGTEWDNFLALRDHEAAEPHIHLLAQRIRQARDASTPVRLTEDQWHLPYIDGDVTASFRWTPQVVAPALLPDELKVSVARCARLSYKTRGAKVSNVEDDLILFDRLVGASPLHASPTEHQASPHFRSGWYPNIGGNLRGFFQLRKMLVGESV